MTFHDAFDAYRVFSANKSTEYRPCPEFSHPIDGGWLLGNDCGTFAKVTKSGTTMLVETC